MLLKYRLIIVGIISLIISSMVACSYGEAGILENKTWVLIFYGKEGNIKAPIADKDITIVFDASSGKVSGSAGCNRYFAEYTIQNNKISIVKVGSTKMMCVTPTGIMSQEQQFLTNLGAAENYQFQDGKLKIMSSGEINLIFVSQ
jgi:heat shock protein HslJ